MRTLNAITQFIKEKKMEKIKQFFKDNEHDIKVFGVGVLVGSLGVYSSIHMGIRKTLKSIRKFVNE